MRKRVVLFLCVSCLLVGCGHNTDKDVTNGTVTTSVGGNQSQSVDISSSSVSNDAVVQDAVASINVDEYGFGAADDDYILEQQNAIYQALNDGHASRGDDYVDITFDGTVGLPVTNADEAVNTIIAVRDIFNIEGDEFTADESKGPEGQNGYRVQQLYDGVVIDGNFFRIYLTDDNMLTTIVTSINGVAHAEDFDQPVSKEEAIRISGLDNINVVRLDPARDGEPAKWFIHNDNYDFVIIDATTGAVTAKGNDGFID